MSDDLTWVERPSMREPHPARCGACQWHGTDAQLIWVVDPRRAFFRCPNCHSHEIWIDMGDDGDDNIEDPPPPHVAKAMSQIAIYAATYGTDDMYLRDPVVAKPIAIVREWLKQWGYTFEEEQKP